MELIKQRIYQTDEIIAEVIDANFLEQEKEIKELRKRMNYAEKEVIILIQRINYIEDNLLKNDSNHEEEKIVKRLDDHLTDEQKKRIK